MVMASGYVDLERQRYGMVRDMISPQDEINKRRSKMLHHLSVDRMTYEDGAVQDADIAQTERAKPDGAVRVATLVNLHSKGRWYRFLIGRFKSLDACESYLQTLEQSFEIHKDARSVKFPFSLSISSGQALGPSQMMIEALRKKGFLAYLSPSAGRAVNYDVMIGAYESEEEAALQVNMLLQNGISAEIVSP